MTKEEQRLEDRTMTKIGASALTSLSRALAEVLEADGMVRDPRGVIEDSQLAGELNSAQGAINAAINRISVINHKWILIECEKQLGTKTNNQTSKSEDVTK